MAIFGKHGSLWIFFIGSQMFGVTYKSDAYVTYSHGDNSNVTLDINIYLYTKSNLDHPDHLILSSNFSKDIHFDSTKETKVLIHGFNQNHWVFAKPFVMGMYTANDMLVH